jgi:hypothetical protein
MLIHLSETEAEVLHRLLANEVADLRPELHHTRSPKFRDELKEYRDTLVTLYQRLSEEQSVART